MSIQMNFNGYYQCSTRDRVVYKEKNYSMSELKKKVKIRKVCRNYIGKTMNNAKEIITAGNKQDFENLIPLLATMKATFKEPKWSGNEIVFLLQSEKNIEKSRGKLRFQELHSRNDCGNRQPYDRISKKSDTEP